MALLAIVAIATHCWSSAFPVVGRLSVCRRRARRSDAVCTVSFLASRISEAMSNGRAHVEPSFLSGEALSAARAEMASVLTQIDAPATSSEFQSFQTDLMNPAFRSSCLGPLPFGELLSLFDELRSALADCTGRELLEHGGLHLMHYPIGSKFMRHVDEDPALYEPERNSVSFLLYLTPDDWSAADGGALRLFEQPGDDGGDGAREVLPLGGTLVVYDSTLEHEVLPTRRQRQLISGRYRETDEDWQRGRSGAAAVASHG